MKEKEYLKEKQYIGFEVDVLKLEKLIDESEGDAKDFLANILNMIYDHWDRIRDKAGKQVFLWESFCMLLEEVPGNVVNREKLYQEKLSNFLSLVHEGFQREVLQYVDVVEYDNFSGWRLKPGWQEKIDKIKQERKARHDEN